MTNPPEWVDVGEASVLQARAVQPVQAGTHKLALTFQDGRFGAISGACNHVGGPLGEGRLEGEYVVCPWHYWKFHARTGLGEPGYEDDKVPAYDVKVEGGRVLVDVASKTARHKTPHAPHALARPPVRAPGPIRILALSTTAMTKDEPRFSTSDALLDHALARATECGFETKLIRLRDLEFRHCEGFYSKSARACTWPCSITQMDPDDQLEVVYEALVHWADVYVIATPIRWGAASSLYFKMVERMNCIQNQETIAGNRLLEKKAAGFIVTGGQDNVQGVVGQMLGFFAELGVQFPQFPFIAHSRGWSAEDMENNVAMVKASTALEEGARALVDRCAEMAGLLIHGQIAAREEVRGGRKAHRLT